MASGSPELEHFVRDALARGHERAQVTAALLAAGWRREQVHSVLDGWAQVDFPLPVPRPKASLSARETFLYLVLFSTLYFFAYHLGSLLFELIEHALPDAADAAWRTVRRSASIRWSISALVIALPVFAVMAWHISREVTRDPIKRLSPVRRWLTWLTLFLAATILLGDLTTLVYNVLGGELTVRFALKALVVGVIAGSVFGYYLWDLRHEEGKA
ncbi:MAG: DUF5671 domain-containing protein [Stenotrophomonas sp.]